MPRLLELNKINNFHLVYQFHINPLDLNQGQGTPKYSGLNDLLISTIFDKSILLIDVKTNIPVGHRWKSAGSIAQLFNTNLGHAITHKEPLYLLEPNLIFFREINSNFTLKYFPPPWFYSLDMKIYQYEGSDTTKLESDVQIIKSNVALLRSKLKK